MEERFDTDLITVYKHPEAGDWYTIGLDAATGFGDDYTSIQVWSNRLPFEQVAWVRNKRLTTYRGSEVLHALARYYNEAFIVPETRHPGNAYVDNLIEKFAYGKIYQKLQTLDESPNQSSKYGITTTDADKALLINNAKQLTESDEVKVIFHDEVTLLEFCNYIYIGDKRKTGAIEGANDDTVMAAMLALHGCATRPQKPKPVLPKYDPENEDMAHKRYLMKQHFARLQKQKEGQVIYV